MNFSEKKILITGGAGFIGSNLCDKLLKLDNEVICFDNFSTGKLKNVKEFLNNPKFKLVEGDIRDFDKCIDVSKGVDYVLHQAALGSVPRSVKDPKTTNAVNIDGFLNMLIASRDSNVKRFIYAASSSTYGDSSDLPKVENNVGRPLSPYAVTKYVNELYADVFSNSYGIEVIGLRYFNVYGRKQDPGGAYAAVIPLFITQLIDGKSPTINGDGSYSRDFTYIDDVVQANLLSLTTSNKKALNEVINIAYGERNTLNDLVKFIKENLSNFDSSIDKIKVLYGPNRPGDIPHSHASILKAKKLLNYEPKFSLNKGLKEAIMWYKNNYNA
tara:strand:+ start:1024 stop:2007 length:984 start_codon:yes stop_codon:yes gene_type:complete